MTTHIIINRGFLQRSPVSKKTHVAQSAKIAYMKKRKNDCSNAKFQPRSKYGGDGLLHLHIG